MVTHVLPSGKYQVSGTFIQLPLALEVGVHETSLLTKFLFLSILILFLFVPRE